MSRGRRVVLGVVVMVLLAASAALGFRAGLDDHEPTAADPTPGRADVGVPPDELPVTGSAIESRLKADGDIVVTQWIRSRIPVTRLAVRTPPDTAGGVRVGEVTVVADGEAVPPLQDAATRPLRFSFGAPAQLVHVRYVLTRALDRSSSVPGRALVRRTFLRVDQHPQQGPTVVTVKAPEVLSLSCSTPRPVLSTPRPCGSATAGGWRVTLRGGDRRNEVMAQVGLRG